MSHTIKLSGNWTAICDGSPGLESEITLKVTDSDGCMGVEHVIPFGILMEFVGEQLRIQKISKLEDASALEIFRMSYLKEE